MSCEKKSFETKELAILKLNEIKELEKDNKNRIPIRSYKCEKCGKYHLTSFTKKTQKKVVQIKKIYESVEYKYRHEIKSVKYKKEKKVKVLKFKNKE